MKYITILLIGMFIISFISAQDQIINVSPYQDVSLPRLSSNLLDTEGLDRTYLFCTWRIDGQGETVELMTSNMCPENVIVYNFEKDEDYVIRIDASDMWWNPILNEWVDEGSPYNVNMTHIFYDMQEPPEPSQSHFDNIRNGILNILNGVKSWLCDFFPWLGICD